MWSVGLVIGFADNRRLDWDVSTRLLVGAALRCLAGMPLEIALAASACGGDLGLAENTRRAILQLL